MELDIKTGQTCPTCGQYAKEYRRKLYSTMALALIYLYKSQHMVNDWVHTSKITKRLANHNMTLGGDMAKLEHWNLIEQLPNDDKRKRSSGYWRPTGLGISFANVTHNVMIHITLYNNELLGFEGKEISIEEALGDKFDYNQLMNRS